MSVNELKIGDKASVIHSFSFQDVMIFSKISTDTNPIHLDEDFAKSSIFKKNIVHGVLVGSLFSSIIGTKMPGMGSIYLSQTYAFRKPIFIDEEIVAQVEVVNIRQDKPIITLKTTCFKNGNEIAIEGEAVVLFSPLRN